jgi:hypothetical protein
MDDPVSEIDGQIRGLVDELARRKEAILRAVSITTKLPTMQGWKRFR